MATKLPARLRSAVRRRLDSAMDAHPGRGSVERIANARAGSSRLAGLRHHPSLWLVPAAMLILAVFPWPYGYYTLLRLAVCTVAAWLAWAQWKHDDAASSWVVALGAIAFLYNPLLPVHLSREIWAVLNILTSAAFVLHFRMLARMVKAQGTGDQSDLEPLRRKPLEPRRSK